ncbi:MAG: 6,7-dimethyl-8-ribityllumazine synthase [Longimicrobiales bacterium]
MSNAGYNASMDGNLSATGMRFAIVSSRFNSAVTDRLVAGARACLLEHGAHTADVVVFSVPGAWELPLAARYLTAHGFDAIVAIGCVIRGDTPHFEYVAGAATDGLANVQYESGVPIGFGLLTVEDYEQAFARAGGREGNKGWESALAALEMVHFPRRLSVHALP